MYYVLFSWSYGGVVSMGISDIIVTPSKDFDIYTRVNMPVKGKRMDLSYHGYLFGLMLALKHRVDNKYHAFIIITGGVGDGKSGLAEGLTGLWATLNDIELSFDHVVWTTDKFIEKTNREDNMCAPIWWDEAVKGATSRKMGITSQGEELMECLVTKRYKRHLYVLLIDDITRYSETIIKMANAWIHVKAVGDLRGHFEAYTDKNKISGIYRWFKYQKQSHWPRSRAFWPDSRGKYMKFNGVWLNEKEYDKRKHEETNKQRVESQRTNLSKTDTELLLNLREYAAQNRLISKFNQLYGHTDKQMQRVKLKLTVIKSELQGKGANDDTKDDEDEE